jgi:DNA-binding NarL/FixJ family response regulator
LTKNLHPDVVLIDIAMPKMDGIEAAKHIRAACPNSVILIVSAYNYEHYIRACIDAGADGYLLKNRTLGTNLISAIRVAHAGEDVFDREIIKGTIRRFLAGKSEKRLGCGDLSSRELEILRGAMKGMSNREIASELNISDQTVGTHFVNIFRKLGVESRLEAALYVLKKGWVSIHELESK